LRLARANSLKQFQYRPGTSTEAVFTCAETAISALNKKNTKWQKNITTRNLQSGLFETNNFNEINVTGVRVQVKYDQISSEGHIKIKASGPYFVDYGTEHAARELKKSIIQCMESN